MLDAALLVVYEGRFREEAVRNQAWTDAQLDKIAGALDAFEAAAGSLGDRVDIGTISVGCGLGYLDLRLGHPNWRAGRPKPRSEERRVGRAGGRTFRSRWPPCH